MAALSNPSVFQRLKQRLPWDSLVVRLALLVFGVAALSLALHILVMFGIVQMIGRDFSSILGALVRSEQALLVQSPPEKRVALAASRSNVRYLVEKLTPNSHDAPEDVEGLMAARLLPVLLREVGRDIEVTFRKAANSPVGEAIEFRFRVDNDVWRILHLPGSPPFVAIGGMIGWLVWVSLAVVVATALGVSLVNKPLRHLSSQLSSRGRTFEQLTTPPRADREVKNLVASFNRLVDENAKAERGKQQMLAGISHDLRTPLTRLRFRAEMGCDPDRLPEIDRDLDVLERIVNQFVGYAQSGSHVGYGEPWPLNEVVARVVSTYDSQGIDVSFAQSDVTYPMPDLAIQRALTNLIENAIEYGRAPVEVMLDRVKEEGKEFVRLTVWDGGEGMSDAEFTEALQPFSRLDRNASSGHCGLGLAIVAQIAEQTGGGVRLERDERRRFGISIVWKL